MSKRSGERERSASTGSQPHSPVNDSPPKSSTKPRDRAPSFASMASGTQPRVLNEKVSVINESPGCATFEFANEDHTLGNVLRMMAMKDPQVSMAAYFVPHPLESRMQLRIETTDESDPGATLKRALDKVVNTCDEFSNAFESSLAAAAHRSG